MKVIGYFLVLVVILAAAYIAIGHFASNPTAQQPLVNTNGVQMTVAKIQEDTNAYTINAQYPQFGIPAIDTQIKAAVESAVNEFKTSPANPPDSATPKITFDGTFDSVYAGPDVVSVELILSQYTGGAHSLTLLSGLNYDRTTGRQLVLDDALKMIGLTVDQVSAQASSQFKQKFGDNFFANGADTNPENFSSFVISADKVTFIFQEYQVAAYSEGSQEISFPRVN